ncbi:hypothetical protein F6G07_03595 [Salmonella enterica]|uniref:Uncharacterized protein n=1 Tax=Salmonella enterica subsp. VII serovar 40:z4,z24:[z39] TaxID=1967625 RepID=A0A731Y0R1_SALEE|nr:hypothetical protein [Salmonella enterica]EDO5295052.1 hypothetical protein [Salmonella enterica subsp. houtenae serovar 40:z4,z24:-]EDT6884646.1 hypothetical protein [Salmonella enterica subsp. enterica]HAE4733984.1 hypothetical protein [Salmonella enterica subsp. VII serovar 40:z4,z24:[z39]]EAZ6553899.1 hypothetical protein [Salmonella enterica]
MPGCINLCSCVSSPTPPEPKESSGQKWIVLKGYCVTTSSQEDIRPLKGGEPKKRMSPHELVMLRQLFKDLGITENPRQDPTVKPNNCGLPFFPVAPGDRETNV